ncbi:MAG: TolC family protein [Gemmataceae bacterium]|nr:TolC family protein [Gemmataceae bacterium]
MSVEALVEQVVARNPSLPQMVAAWQAAAAKYPQVTSLDDPLFGTTLAPGALGSKPNGYRFEVFQRFPFPGKLPLKGEVARAEASAAGRDVEDVRQQLTEAARDAFYEYYLVARATEVNEELLKLLRSSRETAQGLYTAGKVKQPDVLLLDVEIGRQENRAVLLDRQRQVAVARMNTLLHQPPDAPLPPPPKELKAEGELPDPAGLRAQALAQRLDLLTLADRIQAAKASLDLARREYYPDFDVMGAYDAFWDNSGQRLQAGVRVNLPVRLARRGAAVAEAQARLAELQAQLARQQDVAGFEVQQGYEQWRESLRTVRLFEKQVLPPARLSVKSAQAEYQTGGVSLLVLLEATRNLANLQDQYYQATAEFFRRRTVLQRALTGTPTTSPLPTPPGRPTPGQPGYPTGMSSRQ